MRLTSKVKIASSFRLRFVSKNIFSAGSCAFRSDNYLLNCLTEFRVEETLRWHDVIFIYLYIVLFIHCPFNTLLSSSSKPNRFASFLTSNRNFWTKANASLGELHANAFRSDFSFCCCTSCPNPTHNTFISPHRRFGSHPSSCSRVFSGVLESTHLRSLLVEKSHEQWIVGKR